MTYSNTKQDAVKILIETYTYDYFDRYTQMTILEIAKRAMQENKTAIEVADAVYDHVYAHNTADITISTVVQQCMPKDVLLVLRQEIINALK